MAARDRYRRAIAALVPAGAIGAAMILGGAPPADAAANPPQASVADRLAAVRDAVAVIDPGTTAGHQDPNVQLVWGNWGWGGRRWGNWGWGGNRWNNWRPRWNNWRNGWRNW